MPTEDKPFWWCNTHQRPATHFKDGAWRCDPKLGGKMIPCIDVVNLTGIAVLDASYNDEKDHYKVNPQLAQMGLSQKDEEFTLSDLLLGLGNKE